MRPRVLCRSGLLAVTGHRIAPGRALLPVVVVLLACGIAFAETDPRLKEFAKLKRRQTEELAAKLHLDVPPEAREFFRAAEAGDWVAVSNCFERISNPGGQEIPDGPLAGLNNVLFMPILETFGAYEHFQRWDGVMLQKYARGILDSLPSGSILYVGGLNPGVFVLRAVRDVAKSPEIFIISLNGLQDIRYMEHLRLMYGKRVWIPDEREIREAFQQYVEDLWRQQQSGESVKGASGVMAITATLSKAIFDRNKDEHQFYVEESYVIPWMYPHLEPHGLIMKLNKQPLDELEAAVVARDQEFWGALTRELLADSRFLENMPARRAFSKLRAAVAGLYAYREMTKEAEAAFAEALQLCPSCPEPTFRLAQFYKETDRTDAALAVLEQLKKRLSATDPFVEHVNRAIEMLRT
jgi:hypothetical protein